VSAYNYAAAFVAFQQGSSFEDIAARLGIPPETLKAEARQHGWKKLAGAITIPTTQIDSLKLDLDAVTENRKRSLKDAAPIEALMGRTLEVYDRWWQELGVAEEHYQMCAAVLDEAMQEYQQYYTAERRSELHVAKEQAKLRPEDVDLVKLIDDMGAPARALESARANEKTAKEERDELRHTAAPSPKALMDLAKAVATIHDIRYRAVGDMVNKGSGEVPIRQTVASITVNMPGAIGTPRERRVIEIKPVDPQQLPPPIVP
jgi:uncharacterized protein YjcR